MADSSSRFLQALHRPSPLVVYTRCSHPSMVSPPARAPCTKHLIVTSKVRGVRTLGSKNPCGAALPMLNILLTLQSAVTSMIASLFAHLSQSCANSNPSCFCSSALLALTRAKSHNILAASPSAINPIVPVSYVARVDILPRGLLRAQGGRQSKDFRVHICGAKRGTVKS